MFDTLHLSPTARRAHECELLARLAPFLRPVQLWELFTGWGGRLLLVPRWADEACDRLLVAGELRADPAGALEVTAAGRARVPKPVPYRYAHAG